jgi:hypothetical protein
MRAIPRVEPDREPGEVLVAGHCESASVTLGAVMGGWVVAVDDPQMTRRPAACAGVAVPSLLRLDAGPRSVAHAVWTPSSLKSLHQEPTTGS